MALKFLNKKLFLVLGFVVFAVLFIGGFFLYQDIEKQSPYKTLWENEYVQDKEFTVKEIDDGKIIENKEERLTIKGPNDWSIIREGEDIAFVSPEVEFDEKGNLIFDSIKEKGGCAFVIKIIKCKKGNSELPTTAQDLEREINGIMNNEEYREKMKNYSPRTEIVSVSGKNGLKRTSIAPNDSAEAFEIEIPLGQTIYHFESGIIFSQFHQKCTAGFYDILNTVSINK